MQILEPEGKSKAPASEPASEPESGRIVFYFDFISKPNVSIKLYIFLKLNSNVYVNLPKYLLFIPFHFNLFIYLFLSS